MIGAIILFFIGYSIWQKLQEDPSRARREARRRMESAQNAETEQSREYRIDRQFSRTKVRQSRMDMVNTVEQTHRRVHAQLSRDDQRLHAMSKRLQPLENKGHYR